MTARIAKPVLALALFLAIPAFSYADFTRIEKMFGKNDAALVTAPDGKVCFSKNAGRKLVPASTLKLLTALAAIHYLGPDFRFKTEFFLDKNGNLKIRGYGDPLLISEVLDEIATVMSGKLARYNDLIIDDSWFLPITVPGASPTFQPYDAPLGALRVNFNTVNFKMKKGVYVSAEPQTPLLPLVLGEIRKSGHLSARIALSEENDLPLRYSGAMFKNFFDRRGIKSEGAVRRGAICDTDELVLRYTSRFSLDAVISKLLTFSNNFIANQLFVATGAKVSGPPGTLEKGIRAADRFMNAVLKTGDINVVEGSGISRKNRICPNDMDRILEKFEPHRKLMPRKDADWYKSGTLSGVNTRAGYMDLGKGGVYRYSVMFNSPGKSAEKTVEKIIGVLKSNQ